MIKKVEIKPGCVSCGTCEVICPDVFEVKNVGKIKNNADIINNQDEIREAVKTCPVGVIEIEEE